MSTVFFRKRQFFGVKRAVKLSLLVLLAASILLSAWFCHAPEIDYTEEPLVQGDPNRIQASQASLQGFLEYWRARGKFYGMTVGVVQGDKLVYTYGSGYTQGRKYHLGSITKIFTATATLRMMEEGGLELDSPISDYLGDLRLERSELGSRPVTIRNLLSHTSGLPDLRYLHPTLISNPDLPFKIPPQVIPAGMHYRYSNTGFMILGEALARRSGTTLSQYVTKEIFEPLEMTETQAPQMTGASGVMTNIEDLSHFAIMFLNRGRYKDKQILKASTVHEMLSQPVYYPPAETTEYCGLGWRVKRGPQGIITFFHIGGADYIAAWLQVFPRYRTAVLYLGDPPSYDDNTMSMLLGTQIKLGDLATAYASAEMPVDYYQPSPPDEKTLEQYPGEYVEVVSGKKVFVTLQNSTLYFQRENSWAYPLTVQTNHVFTGGYMALSHDFVHEPGTNKLIGIAAYDGFYKRETQHEH
ncbi:MAG: beta-lactamase family protein [Spirochaetia bacterium]|nr:beta-lactamase family protein [Spirochaetia bacterium]